MADSTDLVATPRVENPVVEQQRDPDEAYHTVAKNPDVEQQKKEGKSKSRSPSQTLDIQEEPFEFEDAPDGGVKAWLVAAGGSAIFFCCLGFANSFGTFEQYYLTHQLKQRSPDAIAWIGSLSVYMQFASGMLGGPLFDRFGAAVIRPAAILHLLCVMLLSLCDTYWQVMLVQGVLMGIAMGCLQIPAIAAVSQHFDKKRAAALGVVVSGSSVGGIVIPIALSRMLNSSNLGFQWSVRITGFLMMPFMLFSCIVVKARLPSRATNFWIPAAYKDAKYLLLIASLFFVFTGMFTPLFFIPTYAVARGMNATLAGYLLAILNAASTFGRIIPGILADKYGRLNLYALGAISTGVIIFCMNSAVSNAALIVYSVAFGFGSGTIISGASAAFSVCPKSQQDIGTYMGMGLAISALGGLIGPPINGAFISKFGGFFEVSMFSGAVCLLGGFVAVATKLATPEGFLGKV
ncbi:hypothetical protein SMACR_08588 [Sordaria macrospora]|uniref:WGS project CABT00000000 data, contig 2.2 n=2 Tax=Sordaria macrospora TaxID=5147 RepID=F7VMM6_SORMK|nr:uncharacterized protein SMAC_08588 [Sordaria macrospora k-hell]KAA8633093.1 hypothetical protein SMACR_08588 [Sordaria macrospora]WPJ62468.1 hypothetical protein SMAC4_08588 [Sordaria macrospora]CCC07207.1 unnamed protein product [Sordaria macrospora k-hell]